MTKEALKLALEALEADPAEMVEDENGHMVFRRIQAIITLREALAQPEHGWTPERIAGIARLKEAQDKKLAQPEPVAWRAWVSKFPQGTGSDWVYVTKPIMKDSVHNQPLYTTPSQRTWVGLEREIATAVLEHCYSPMAVTSDMIESTTEVIKAKLKEKNT